MTKFGLYDEEDDDLDQKVQVIEESLGEDTFMKGGSWELLPGSPQDVVLAESQEEESEESESEESQESEESDESEEEEESEESQEEEEEGEQEYVDPLYTSMSNIQSQQLAYKVQSMKTTMFSAQKSPKRQIHFEPEQQILPRSKFDNYDSEAQVQKYLKVPELKKNKVNIKVQRFNSQTENLALKSVDAGEFMGGFRAGFHGNHFVTCQGSYIAINRVHSSWAHSAVAAMANGSNENITTGMKNRSSENKMENGSSEIITTEMRNRSSENKMENGSNENITTGMKNRSSENKMENGSSEIITTEMRNRSSENKMENGSNENITTGMKNRSSENKMENGSSEIITTETRNRSSENKMENGSSEIITTEMKNRSSFEGGKEKTPFEYAKGASFLSFKQSFDGVENQVISLCSALFDPLPLYDRSGYSQEQCLLIDKAARQSLVARWLSDSVRESGAIGSNNSENVGGGFNSERKVGDDIHMPQMNRKENKMHVADHIFNLLISGRVAEACSYAIKTRNFRLATLISQTQANVAVKTKYALYLPNGVRGRGASALNVRLGSRFDGGFGKIYDLLSGDVVVGSTYSREKRSPLAPWDLLSTAASIEKGSGLDTGKGLSATSIEKGSGLATGKGLSATSIEKGSGLATGKGLSATSIEKGSGLATGKGLSTGRGYSTATSIENGTSTATEIETGSGGNRDRAKSSDWLRHFSSILLYSKEGLDIAKAIDQYKDLVGKGLAKKPYLTNSKKVFDLRYQLLEGNLDLEKVLDYQSYTSDIMNVQLQYILGLMFQTKKISKFRDSLTMDRLTLNMVTGMKEWKDALFVAMGYSNQDLVKFVLQQSYPIDDYSGSFVGASYKQYGAGGFIDENLGSFNFEQENSLDNTDSEDFRYLVQLGVNVKWIHESRALKARYMNNQETEIICLIDCEEYSLAHSLLIMNGLSKLINRPEFLLKMLQKLEEYKEEINGWKLGGFVILEYLNGRTLDYQDGLLLDDKLLFFMGIGLEFERTTLDCRKQAMELLGF